MLVPNGLTSALGGPKPVPMPPKVSPLEVNSPKLEADQKTLQTQELQIKMERERLACINTPQSRGEFNLQVLRCESVIKPSESHEDDFIEQNEY